VVMKLTKGCQVSVAFLGLLFAMPLAASTVRIYITNSAGDGVDVIDPLTNKVVDKIDGIEIPSGVAFSPDAKWVYFSCEGEKTLDFVDRQSKKIIHKIPLSGRPNSIAASADGKLVFVAIAEGAGGVDVIDTAAVRRIKTIPINGSTHYAYLTPDNKDIAAISIVGKTVTIIDIATLQPVAELEFSAGARPVAFELGPDGLTSRMFVQLSDVHGFQIVNFKTRELGPIIKLPSEPISVTGYRGGAPSHGIAVAPDNKTLWVNSSVASAVFIYSLPDIKLLGHVSVGDVPDWFTFTPDGKTAYVSVSGENLVSAIDTKTFKEIARIPVGEVPKRSGTLVVP
jgi:YVTN family beta-propeller protein